MCYLLHVKKGYSCQHDVLEQRHKVLSHVRILTIRFTDFAD